MRKGYKIVASIVLFFAVVGGLMYFGLSEATTINKKYSPVINGEVVDRPLVPSRTLEITNKTAINTNRILANLHQMNFDIQSILKSVEKSDAEVAELRKEVSTLKSEVMRGINLIPASIKVEKPSSDPDKLAVIKVINDKLNVVATNAVTKEDLEKLKASVMQVLEENKAIKAEKEKEAVPAAPPVVLPSLSEEFPKK